MADGVYGLIGAVIGGTISLATAFGLDYIKQRRDAYSLAHAFRGGIGALLSVIERRNYVQFIEMRLEAVREGDRSPFVLRAKRNYVELYNKNVDRIGSLSPTLAEQLPIFYTYVNSLLEDVDNLAEGFWDDAPQTQLIAVYEELLALLLTVIALGREIQAAIKAEYSGLWPKLRLPG